LEGQRRAKAWVPVLVDEDSKQLAAAGVGWTGYVVTGV